MPRGVGGGKTMDNVTFTTIDCTNISYIRDTPQAINNVIAVIIIHTL